MGQYYMPINLDKKEYADAHDYGNGLKLMEHSWIGNNFVNSLLYALRPGGAWYHNRIVWAGDYMDEALFLDEFGPTKESRTLYNFAINGNGFEKIAPSEFDGPAVKYLVNHSAGEYVDLNNLPEEADGSVIHPLPLLTCSGNGRGGGDFRGQNDFVERWAGAELSSEYDRPVDMVEIRPDFMET